MKFPYRIWLYAIVLTAIAAASIQSMIEERRDLSDASGQGSAVLMSVEESIATNYHAKRLDRIAKIFDRLRAKEGIVGLGICEKGHGALSFPKGAGFDVRCENSLSAKQDLSQDDFHWSETQGRKRLQFTAHEGEASFHLILAQDISPIQSQWISSFLRTFFLTFGICVALLTLAFSQFRDQVRQILRRKKREDSSDPARGVDRWFNSLREVMRGRRLVVIANREPYIHQKKETGFTQVMRPASGLVTALEPILRKLGGMWIGHGSGNADRETVDSNDMVAVPPSKPSYQLKRVWLTKEEEEGYYYGFSNEGLWPLCHLAHTRPTFRLDDWEQYQLVNRKFADAVPVKALNDRNLILVQDYHFALLPSLLRARAELLTKKPAKIGIFWHIPWPNPEAFGICPWNVELLHGMLGADVIGFHTQYHCNNFLETCNRYLEARIDLERFSVTINNRTTLVRAFPIGIETSPVRVLSEDEIDGLKLRYGIHAKYIAVGVDRIDYTKGIIERVQSVERFLEKNPEYIGEFSLVQMGSPSRTHIPAYKMLHDSLNEVVDRVNAKFSKGDYRPIIFLSTHHEWDEIQYFYQMGDLCMVTSLHDGMNLVAKEYVWCQRADRGALVLSKFTGASRELTEAFIVNPYSIEEMADAISASLKLTAAEKSARMIAMKQKIQANNAFHWASTLIRALVSTNENVSLPTTEQDLRDNYPSTNVASF